MPVGGVMSALATPISPLNSDCRITSSDRFLLFIAYLVGKNSCEKTSMAAHVSTSDKPAHSTTLLYHLSPSPARKVSPEFQKVTGFSWVPGVGTGWIRVPAMQASMEIARQTGAWLPKG